MCGIFGSLGFAPDQSRIQVVSHRGPDGTGWKEFAAPAGPVALGHRRLAIIDVSDAGLQPMADASGRYHLVFNGELYNYVELRDELRVRGEVFRTDSDSEVLLRAYMIWGAGALDRFLGMFAFAIWDDAEKRMFIARDRFGIKPLYFVSNRGVAFASEIKQLLGLPGLTGRMNYARVYDFLASGISDHTSETMFEGVHQLRGGECAIVEAGRPEPLSVQIRRWYDVLDPNKRLSLSEKEASEQFRDILTDAVRMHLRSDVPVGSCLSGGLDSSSIVCLMTNMLAQAGNGARVNTVSACYAEKSVDERPFMDAVIAHTNAKPHFTFPRAEDVFTKAAEITWHQDEPFGSTSIFAQWCVFEEARRAGIKVMLDGQGADEQLAGYHSSFGYYMSDLIRRNQWIMVIRTIGERTRMHGVPVSEQIQRFIIPLLPTRFATLVRRQRQTLAQHDWLGSEALRPYSTGVGAFQTATESLGLPPVTDLASLCMTLTYASNLQMLLHWEDRNSMAHSVEARVPFVDHRLVEFSLMLGNHHKTVGGDTKRVLRRAMHGILPEKVENRRDKLGFATPEEIWFRGPLKNAIRDGVEGTLSRYPGLLNAPGARALTSDMLEGRRPVDFTLWRVANLGIWGERFGVAA